MSIFRRTRKRAGITLIELLVVLTIMASLVAVGGGLMAPQISHFSARSGVEEIVWALRRAQTMARSRGLPYRADLGIIPPGVAPAQNDIVFGVALWRGRYGRVLTGPIEPTLGYSYMVYSQNDPIEGHRPIPTGDLNSVAAADRGWVNSLPLEVQLTRVWNPGQALPARPITDDAPAGVVKIQFYSDGNMDMYQSAAGCNSTIGALTRLDTLPLPSPVPGLINGGFACWSFDVVSPVAGWMRVRIRPGGSIENSAIGPLDQAPQTRAGKPF